MNAIVCLLFVTTLPFDAVHGENHVNQVPCPGLGDHPFEKVCIIPDLISQAPEEILKIQFLPSGLTLNNGNKVTSEEVKNALL
ncbi:hypothetical protein BV898_02657 [Hypsibius exemplaris]|uniref:Uncharacterized protein n=1 Tax=Hypsibius exemplaris TaxID=2072580 RepID=A0A1W0X836_HYPEX|nr:hypothetical protein BV898_02657 [Hypsibius exemplaris]